ncbi:MAG: TetR/AcrR family transcriptional regulator [Phenylobacterium sp.]|jgi:AcrR family transcriptional regulator|uniref:TetR/AcrR family transcriptional regulator n=1 Tax=Phenylobacterium sp. TaxID=1871053 RepID=UPI002A35CD76|nr:TetR/AcrR family transcriptional regulator [Phenylobacterium sp.]MDX9997423.1 TetR/AcrR family transcriptional regulator [Phenylobacterium sp.]
MSRDASGGQRLTRAAREQQIIESAAALVVEYGCLPLPLEALGQQVGVSKALIYAYFPTQQDLAARILVAHLDIMGQSIEAAFRAGGGPREVALRCAEAYFDHVCRHGRLIHLLLSDPMAAGVADPAVRRHYGRIMRRLSVSLRDGFDVPDADCVAAVQILAALAEDAGEQVFTDRLDPELGRALTRELTDGALCGLTERLRPPARSPAAS